MRIGISGWTYAPWRGVFYPPKLPQREELAYASRALPTIELNGSFHSLQPPAAWQAWHDSTPAGFCFAVKGPRYLTNLRLRSAPCCGALKPRYSGTEVVALTCPSTKLVRQSRTLGWRSSVSITKRE